MFFFLLFFFVVVFVLLYFCFSNAFAYLLDSSCWLSRLFSKKMSRYCHNPVVGGGVVAVQKL